GGICHVSTDLTELRGEGWRRLLAAARRSLERTGGALGGSVGLNAPTDAERRVVIGITGSYRPQTAQRLTVGLTTLDAALRQRYGTGLHHALVMLGGPLRDRPARREAERRGRTEAIAAAGESALAKQRCRATAPNTARCGRCTGPSPTIWQARFSCSIWPAGAAAWQHGG